MSSVRVFSPVAATGMGLGLAGGGFATDLLYALAVVALLLTMRETGLRIAVRSRPARGREERR